MNKVVDKAKLSIIRQKKRYLLLIGLVIVGIILGGIFTTVLSQVDKTLVKEQLSFFFSQLKMNKIDYTKGLINSISSNFLFGIGIWLLGISIIGLPIILFLIFMKGFITGFSIGSMICFYRWKGILGAILYIFPHHLIVLMIGILLSFYAISFSVKLFRMLFLKKEINFKEVMRRYIKIFVISMIVLLIASLLETFLSPFLLKFFVNMI